MISGLIIDNLSSVTPNFSQSSTHLCPWTGLPAECMMMMIMMVVVVEVHGGGLRYILQQFHHL